MLDSRAMNRALTIRYGTALGLIASLSVCAFLLMEFQFASKQTHASLINVSGRQRMLSQAIPLDAGELFFGRTEAERIDGQARMQRHISEMAEAHRMLVSGEGPFLMPDEMGFGIADAYFRTPDGLDAQVHAFLRLGRAFVNGELSDEAAREALNTLSEMATGPLLVDFSAMVDRYEAYANAALDRAATLHRAIFILMALLLVFEVVFIFRPLAARLSRQTEELARMARNLAETATDLAAMKDEMEGLVSAIAQDLRVPSTAIRGLADWLTDDLAGKIDDAQHGLLVRLRERSHRFESLLADLQSLCRDVSGGEAARLLDVETIENAVLADVYVPEGFHVTFGGRLPKVGARMGPFVVVLRQLLGEVLRTLPGEERAIDVVIGWQGNVGSDDLCLLVQIIDEDATVEPGAGTSVRRPPDPTGMGFSLVRKIVTARGGELSVVPHDDGTMQLQLVWPLDGMAMDDRRFAMAEALDRLDEVMLRTARGIGAFAGQGGRSVAERSGLVPPSETIAAVGGANGARGAPERSRRRVL